MLKEWPLVAFTILGQTAAGVLLAIGLPWLFFGVAAPGTVSETLWLTLLGFVLGTLTAALALSFFHLHHPLRARRALANLRTSWLSREILFAVAFMAFVGLEALLTRMGWGPLWLSKLVMGAACLSATLFLLSMIALYRLPTLPIWSRGFTPLSFVLPVVSLGALTTTVVLFAFRSGITFGTHLLRIALLSVFLEIGLSLSSDRRRRQTAGPSLRPPGRPLKGLYLTRLALLVIGSTLLWLVPAFIALNSSSVIFTDPPDPGPIGYQIGALALIAIAEFLGRFLFYGLVPRPGD
jgi:Tat-targeted selenate reductase subunit YnfH